MRYLHVFAVLFAVFILSVCNDGGGASVSTTPYAGTAYTIGSVVSGLTASGLVLQNNGGDNPQVNTGATGLTFLSYQADTNPYNVTVFASLTGLGCPMANGSDVVMADTITSVQITCISKNDIASRRRDDTFFAGYYGALLGFHSMSSDMCYVAFDATAAGPASGSTTASGKQIFLRDRLTNKATLISRVSGISGVEANRQL